MGLDVVHELGPRQRAPLHLGQFVLPFAGEFGRGELVGAEAAQQGDEREGLGGRDQLLAVAQDVGLADQVFDDLGAGCRGAEAATGHGGAQFLVVHHLAGAFHRGEQRGFVEACGRLGDQRLDEDLVGGNLLAGLDGHQLGRTAFVLAHCGGLAIHGQPARIDEHLALGLEGFTLDTGDTGGDAVFGRRVEHRQEAPGDQIVDLGFGLRQALGRGAGGHDRKVVGDLGVVEDALVRLDPALLDDLVGEGRVSVRQAGKDARHLAHVVFGQRTGVGTRVGQHLVLFVQGLGQLQRGAGREAKAAVGLALKGGEIEQQRRELGGRLGFFLHRAGLAFALGLDGLGAGFFPQAEGGGVLGERRAILGLPETFVEPAAHVGAGLAAEAGFQLPVVGGLEGADLLLALDDDRQRGG